MLEKIKRLFNPKYSIYLKKGVGINICIKRDLVKKEALTLAQSVYSPIHHNKIWISKKEKRVYILYNPLYFTDEAYKLMNTYYDLEVVMGIVAQN